MLTSSDVLFALESLSCHGPNAQSSIALLEKWENDENFLNIVFDVLKESDSDNVNFFIGVALDHKVPVIWDHIEEVEREDLKRIIIEKIFSTPDKVAYGFCKALAHIAVYEWPEIWNGFHELLVPREEDSKHILILEAFLMDVEESNFITERRRQELRNNVIKDKDYIWFRLERDFMNQDFMVIALRILNIILKWFPSQFINDENIKDLCLKFLSCKNTIKLAVKCLVTIYFERIDSEEFFCLHYLPILETLCVVKISDMGLPITSHPDIINFLLKLLNKYTEVLFYFNDENINQYLSYLFQILLSLDSKNLCKKFWLIWKKVALQLIKESNQKSNLIITPLFKSMIPMIRESLFINLQYAKDEDGILLVEAEQCWIKWVELDYQKMNDFLIVQSPSPSLCYAVGCQGLLAEDLEIGKINELIQISFLNDISQFEDDIDYILALLYGISRASSFLKSMDLFQKFSQFSYQCLQNENENISNAASYTFLYLSVENPEFFLNDDKEFAKQLIEQCETFIGQLSRDSSIRMYQCIVYIIQQIKNNDLYFKKAFEPLLYALSNLELTETALMIISECSNLCLTREQKVQIYEKIVNIVFPRIIEIAKNIIPNPEKSERCVEVVLNAISSCFVAFDFEQIQEQVYYLLDLMILRNQILSCYFNFICDLRSIFCELNNSWERIYSSFVIPAIQQDPPLLSEVLNLVTCFESDKIDLNWFINLCITSILVLDRNANIASCNALEHIFGGLKSTDFCQFFNEYGINLFIAILNSIFDSMHKTVFHYHVNLLYKMCYLLVCNNMNSDEITQFFYESLQRCTIIEPEENFFKNIANELNLCVIEQNKEKFKRSIKNFLILLNRISPGDEKTFTNNHGSYSFVDDDIVDSFIPPFMSYN